MIWPIGYTLQNGKYEILDVLGQGGFGVTYKVLHVQLESTMVVKTPNEYLKHDPDYDKYVARFIKEGRLLEKLEPHPHIVRVRDLFQDSDTYCLVMDYVDGENLFQLVKRRGAIPEAEAVLWIQQIGEALSFLHQNKHVHRDAHPGNIMVHKNGKAVLIDFGIAKGLVPTTLSSTSNAGNAGFAPYEQLFDGSREPGVDVYCLAASFYFVVTGQRPETSTAQMLGKRSLRSPSQVRAGLSAHLNQAILKGMALEARDRPQSMKQWLRLLRIPSSPQMPPLPNQSEAPTYKPPTPPASNHRPIPTIPPPKRKQSGRKPLPWLELVVFFTFYGLQGFFIVKAWAGAGAWAWAGAWALALALAGAGAGALAWALAWDWSWAGALAGALALAWVAAGVWVGAWAGAGAWAWALAWVGAGAKAGAEAGAWAWAGAGAWALVGAWVGAGALALAWAWAGAGAWALAWAWAGAWALVGAKKMLDRHFLPVQIFWILSGTATAGLLSGALFGWLSQLSQSAS